MDCWCGFSAYSCHNYRSLRIISACIWFLISQSRLALRHCTTKTSYTYFSNRRSLNLFPRTIGWAVRPLWFFWRGRPCRCVWSKLRPVLYSCLRFNWCGVNASFTPYNLIAEKLIVHLQKDRSFTCNAMLQSKLNQTPKVTSRDD
jgi:hypothetical protein